MKKEYGKAIARADKYLRKHPNDIDLLRLRASCLNESGQGLKALADMRKMHAARSGTADSGNNLGYQLATLGIELDLAEKLIRQSLAALGPSSPNYIPPLDSLGWALYKQGKLHEAGKVFLEVIRRSREREYKHPILFDHAGDVFYRLGWKKRAVELWTEAVKLAKEEELETREVTNVLRDTPGKITAVNSAKAPKVAPLGKGIKAPGG